MRYTDRKNLDVNQIVAQILNGERESLRFTKDELSESTGIPIGSLKRMLAGQSDISVVDLCLFATAFNMRRRGEPVTPMRIFELAVERAGGYEMSLSDPPDSPEGGLFADVVEQFDREVRERGDGFEDTAAYAEFRAQHFGHRAPVRKAATSDPELDTDEPGTP